jgi:menaquinone-dependent protoporphyrinogen IX oxidase
MKRQHFLPSNGAVIYAGKYGSTQQYAEWIGEDLDIPVFDINKTNPNLEKYDTVILGSAVFVGKYYIKKWLDRNWPILMKKKIILFTVSGAAPDNSEIKKYYDLNIPINRQEKIEYFPLRGRLKIEDLNWFIKLFLKMGAMLEKDVEARKRMKEGFDFVSRKNIEPVVEAYRELILIDEPLKVE